MQVAKLEEMENRLRRNNLRVIGLPERSQGSKPIVFLEELFKEIFDPTSFSPLFVIERAHRVPSKAPQPGSYPRVLLLKLLNFNDKVTLL